MYFLKVLSFVCGRFGDRYRRPGDSVCVQETPGRVGIDAVGCLMVGLYKLKITELQAHVHEDFTVYSETAYKWPYTVINSFI